MHYIWSKKSLLEFIEESIIKITWNNKNLSFADLFAGTWIIGRHFKKKWYKIISNDIQYYSYVLNRNYIWNNKKLEFNNLFPEIKTENKEKYICEYLNNLDWIEWFIYKNYSYWWTKWKEFERMYFSDENALKCDAIRIKIEEWKNTDLINEDEYFFLLTTLLTSIDKVSNTASVYGSFLKKLKKTALKSLILEPIEIILSQEENEVYNQDINNLIKDKEFDIVYLDPPYNHRQYSSNYHILETIALYDEPIITWKTWMRDCSSKKSTYCSKILVKKTFKELIDNIQAKYIFLSYNSEWLLSLEDIKEIMSSQWEYWYITKEYRRFKSDKAENKNYKEWMLYEYLHYLIKK